MLGIVDRPIRQDEKHKFYRFKEAAQKILSGIFYNVYNLLNSFTLLNEIHLTFLVLKQKWAKMFYIILPQG